MSASRQRKQEREIIVELHNILELFRTIFADDKMVCRNIDETYEKYLIADIRLVPVQYDDEIMKYVNLVKLVVTNINYKAILEGMPLIDPSYKTVGLELNSYHGAEKALERINIAKTDKLKITNIMTKLRPIFSCVDRLFMMPYNVITNITNLTTTKYDDLL